MTSLEWTPGTITGVIASECIAETRQEVDLPVYGGHFSQSVPALLDAIRHRHHRHGQRIRRFQRDHRVPSSRAARPASP